ncbi:SMI1/KNR4 family protein [Actinokineospora soli]|uniref:SMI1/KNR4 family protein n=1 Tax=Actinokineospora soli TaxID=1048753 RepID=A0ABW2TK51_9PSEU
MADEPPRGGAWFCGGPSTDAWTYHPLHRPHRAQLIAALDATLRGPDDNGPLALEVLLHADGTAEFGHSFAFSSITPPTLVLDPDYACPGHHQAPVPDTARPTGAPTDPAVLSTVEALVREFIEHYQRVKGRVPEFGAPVDEADLAAAETRLGLRLPDDLRALYRVVGDDRGETGLLGRYAHFPLASLDAGAWEWQTSPFEQDVVFDPDQPGAVRRAFGSASWVVVASDPGGEGIAVDLDPGPEGRYGQLITNGQDTDGQVRLVAESVTALLTGVVGALRAGEVDPDFDADHSRLVVVDTTPYPDPIIESHNRPGDLHELFAEHDPGAVQHLYLNDADVLDLRALSAAPRLRALSVNRAGRVELWLPETVESLFLDAREVDLPRITAHPALWDLTLSGMRVQVRDLPPVERVDLSGADVVDVEALADLDIRVLTLSLEQWDVLRAAGRLPKRVAAVRIAGNVRLPHAVAWKDWLGERHAG